MRCDLHVHTVHSGLCTVPVLSAFTWSPITNSGAADIDEFLMGLRSSRTITGGAHGNWWNITSTVHEIGVSLMKREPWMLACCLLLGVAPMVTLANYFKEMMFASYWGRRNRSTHMRDNIRDGIRDGIRDDMRDGIAREAA